MKNSFSFEEQSVIVRIEYELTLGSDLYESCEIIRDFAVERGVSGFLEKGVLENSLLLTLDGEPLVLGEFIMNFHSSLPDRISVTDLKVLNKKELSSYKKYKFKNTLQAMAGDIEREISCNAMGDFDNLGKLLSGHVVYIYGKDSGECDGMLCVPYLENTSHLEKFLESQKELIIIFKDLDALFKYCEFSSDIVKAIVNTGIAENVNLLKPLCSDETIMEKLENKQIRVGVPKSDFFMAILNILESRFSMEPILFFSMREL